MSKNLFDTIMVMLTPEQEARLSRFRDDDAVEVFSFKPQSLETFEKIKATIKKLLGEVTVVELRGSTGLGISGKGELDVYISVTEQSFDLTTSRIEELFGKPKSLYSLDRARFITSLDGIEIEIFVVSNTGKSWTRSTIFEEHLKANQEDLNSYEKLKWQTAGLSTRAYYKAKEEFIGNILNKIDEQESSK